MCSVSSLVFRSQGRRSVYLARLLQKRATVEELRTRGIIKDNAVFGCALEHQKMHCTNTRQVTDRPTLRCPQYIFLAGARVPLEMYSKDREQAAVSSD